MIANCSSLISWNGFSDSASVTVEPQTENGINIENEHIDWILEEPVNLPDTRLLECKKSRVKKPALITGGAGFIGTNLANRLLSQEIPVIIYDNLSRQGSQDNLDWLKNRYGHKVKIIIADMLDFKTLSMAVSESFAVYHFAAQVAVTSSLDNPQKDFEINAGGTLNLLETMRMLENPPSLLFTSTNKVYGELADLRLIKRETRYEPADRIFRENGIDEKCPLNFHSPYGCSKGAADQYILDYSRVYQLPATVFRMSCIYGPHQFGTEDQDWVAHFVINIINDNPVIIFGDGCQVCDILYVEDLIDAMLAATKSIEKISGKVFNIGGGTSNTVSPLEIIDLMGTATGKRPVINFREWRSADQKYYASNTNSFTKATGWHPQVDYRRGVKLLSGWLSEHIVPTIRQATG